MLKKIELLLKKIFTSILHLISKENQSSEIIRLDENTSVLFIRLNRIGDALISTPLISLIKRKFNPKIFLLADRKNYFVFKNNPHLSNLIVYEKGIKGILSVLKFIKKEKINVLVDLHYDLSTTVSFLMYLARSRYKVGLRKDSLQIYTHSVEQPDPTCNHIIDRVSSLSRIFNINLSNEDLNVEYYPEKNSLKRSVEFISITFPQKKFLLGINISAGSDARFWGKENYKKLLDVLRKYEINILLFADPKDKEIAKEIISEKFIYPITNNFDFFAAGILQLDMLFTPDTSAVHIASIKKIPVFGLYVKYKTNDMIWSPYKTDFDCVLTEEPNLKNVKFDQVINKFIPFFEKHLNVKRSS